MDDSFKKPVKLAVILVLVVAIGFTLMRQWRFALGLLVSVAWSVTNFLLLINILKIAMLHKSKEKLSLILLIKFPLLYLIGFLILTSKFFPVLSLLLGVGSILLAVGVINVWPKHI